MIAIGSPWPEIKSKHFHLLTISNVIRLFVEVVAWVNTKMTRDTRVIKNWCNKYVTETF